MQNLLNDLMDVLKQDERFTTDGKLLKNKIIEAGLQLDHKLIKYLLSEENIKKVFFQDIEGIMVFDKIKFQKFISNKQFLPDSFTEFKNRIGLTADNEYLTDSKEVVLAWAYKDCILEGGQDKEDSKRQEIFWNETLAPNDIDRLLYPKVLTNFKKITSSGEENIKDLSLNDNLIIKGNNLLSLYTIRKLYKDKVKLIYIDPPFNTNNDSFQYNDSFNHSTWLTFIKNRLLISKELLSKDGIIFINIDAIEEAYLKVLCDEIFGRENFINIIAVKSSTPSGTKTAHKEKTIIKQKDLILVYKKQNVALTPQYTKRDDWDTHYSLLLHKNEDGSYYLTKLVDELIQKGILQKGQKLDDVNINNKAFKDFYIKNSERIARLQSHKNKEADVASRNQKDTVYEHFDKDVSKGLYYNGQVVTPLKQGIKRVYVNQKFTEDLGMLLCDFWSDIDFQNTQNEGGTSFPTAKKPELLLSRIIEMATKPNDIVLDFFLGSGTTACVALKSGRRFIGIEQMDYGNNDSVVRLKNVISGEQSGVSKAYEWNGGGSFVYCELKKANQSLIDEIIIQDNNVELSKIWLRIQNAAFISYKVTPQSITATAESFEALNIDGKKQFLIEVLDKNMLYVNLNDIENMDFSVSDEEKRLTNLFYSMK